MLVQTLNAILSLLIRRNKLSDEELIKNIVKNTKFKFRGKRIIRYNAFLDREAENHVQWTYWIYKAIRSTNYLR